MDLVGLEIQGTQSDFIQLPDLPWPYLLSIIKKKYKRNDQIIDLALAIIFEM